MKIQPITICWYVKTECTGKFTVLNDFIGKEERCENNDLMFYLKKLDKEYNKPKQVGKEKKKKA